MNEKTMFLKINTFGQCEIAWLPWQPLMQFLPVEVYIQFNHILADTYHILLILAPNKRLDICLLSDDMRCKLPNCIFMNIHENLQNKG